MVFAYAEQSFTVKVTGKHTTANTTRKITMLSTTATAISAMLNADPSLTPNNRAAIMAAIRNYDKNTRPASAPVARLLKRREVAARLGCCPRTVDGLARAGSLRRVLLPGRRRGAGFVESDVICLIESATIKEVMA